MKAKIISMPCRHASNRSIAGKDNGKRYWAIELTETGTGERVYLKIPMDHYPLDPNGYEDHDAAKTLLGNLLAPFQEWGEEPSLNTKEGPSNITVTEGAEPRPTSLLDT